LIADRRGIVAAITGALAEFEIELLELTQTVVSGYFTITLSVAMPPITDLDNTLPAAIRTRLGGDAAVTLIPFHPSVADTRKTDRYILTAIGEAPARVVHSLTELVAERGGNFVDFSFQNGSTGVSFMAEMDLPADIALGQLQIDLQAVGSEAGLKVRLQHQRLFTATNDIAFRRVGS
jgi:predicted amino acid-binding ACT domain protein